MQQALTFPFFRSVALGGLLLALTVVQFQSKPRVHRLALHAVSQPGALYLTAWRNGDVRVSLDGDELVPLTFQTRAWINDGCRWQGTETLVPLDARRYTYRYDETILDCEPGATPFIKTPRTGIVSVED